MKESKPYILIITELFPNQERSFLGTFVVDQLKTLKKYYNIVVIAPCSLSIRKKLESRQPAFVNFEGIKVYYIEHFPHWLVGLKLLHLITKDNYFLYNKKMVRKKIVSLAKKLYQKYHFSLVHGHEVYIGDEAVPIGEKLHVPSVVTIDGLYDFHISVFGEKVMPQILHNLSLANQLITVSSIAKRSYLGPGKLQKDIVIIANGVTEKPSVELPDHWKKIIEGKKVVLGVGFFIKEKRFDQIIQATKILKKKINIPFIVLLIGWGELKRNLEDEIKRLNLKNDIHIVGEVPPNKIGAFFSACDFLVHPSITESFSMVCLEAMSYGKPFICTANAGITDFITNGKEAFVIPPDDLNALTEKMSILLYNHDLRRKMGEIALQTAHSFRWENLIHKTLHIYEQLIKTK